jgi:hypothetical protein
MLKFTVSSNSQVISSYIKLLLPRRTKQNHFEKSKDKQCRGDCDGIFSCILVSLSTYWCRWQDFSKRHREPGWSSRKQTGVEPSEWSQKSWALKIKLVSLSFTHLWNMAYTFEPWALEHESEHASGFPMLVRIRNHRHITIENHHVIS